jgi:F420-dependent oxidoreductase-like protein
MQAVSFAGCGPARVDDGRDLPRSSPRGALAVTVQFGVLVPQGCKQDLSAIEDPIAQFEAMIRVAKAADAEPGWSSVWVYDHFHTVPEPTMATTFECWSVTAALARDTKRVRIGQLVSCNGFRNPALYAKLASTVDVASHGRLDAGLGAGWYEHEWRAYGYDFPPLGERMRMFREAVEIIHRMWTEDVPRFHGRHYTIDGPINQPRGIQKPHPPLWIGGGGEQVTLKLVAQYGDASNFGGGNLDLIRTKIEVLKRHCDALGRDYDAITKSTAVNILLTEADPNVERASQPSLAPFPVAEDGARMVVGPPDRVRSYIHTLVDAGIDYVIVYLPGIAYDQEPLHRFAAEVIPDFV